MHKGEVQCCKDDVQSKCDDATVLDHGHRGAWAWRAVVAVETCQTSHASRLQIEIALALAVFAARVREAGLAVETYLTLGRLKPAYWHKGFFIEEQCRSDTLLTLILGNEAVHAGGAGRLAVHAAAGTGCRVGRGSVRN